MHRLTFLHVGLGHTADLFVIAPATANTIAKLAHGLADNLLVLAGLSFGPGTIDRPLLIAPAMDGGMLNHPATQENQERLRLRGALIIGPELGHLASGLEARGRMTEPAVILGHIRYLLTRRGPLQGRRVVVTAGGTQESIDPVRLITNRSSGKQGYALAQAALDAGRRGHFDLDHGCPGCPTRCRADPGLQRYRDGICCIECVHKGRCLAHGRRSFRLQTHPGSRTKD